MNNITCSTCGREFKSKAGLASHLTTAKCKPESLNEVMRVNSLKDIVYSFKLAHNSLIEKKQELIKELESIDEQLANLKSVAISYEGTVSLKKGVA